jgi:alkylation response protein AidB-like acyl-CoA dehydrogenase
MATSIINEKGKSKEEIEALEVAESAREQEWHNPSFVAELFMGRLRTEMLMPFPEQPEEDRKIGDAYLSKVDHFFKDKVDANKIDETGEIPPEVMKGLADLGAFGIKIPQEYGGMGLSQMNTNRFFALTGGYCASTSALLSAHQSIGVPQPLKLFGTEEQKRKYLPRLARGAVSAFALTEPEVGSDPARMSTTATPIENGDYYLINGTKLWCTNGVIADVIVVMAQTPSIKDARGREKKQITAFIVEKGTPGFEVVHRCRFMGLNGIQNGVLKFTNVKVPKENIIWGLGKGLRLALITLNAGRLSIPAGTVGGARKAIQIAKEWGNERVQWGAPIGQHEAGADKISSMAAQLFAIESITWLTSMWVDQKSHDIRLEAAMAKLFASERSLVIAEELYQFRGGRGFEKVSSLKARGEKPYPIERFLRDGRINTIVEGTSDILRLFIAREALDRHLKIAGDVLNPKVSMGKRLGTALRAGLFYATWYPFQWLAPLLLWLYWPRYSHLGKLALHMRYASRTSHRLARTIFHLMIFNGPKLEKRQLQLMRVVDIATDLFAMTASISRAHSEASKSSEHKNAVAVTDLFCRQAQLRIESQFRAIKTNFDALKRNVSKEVLQGKYEWLEQEQVFDRSIPVSKPSSIGNQSSSLQVNA